MGLVGDTGTSTGPHLHYEVRYKGNAVDPVTYVLDDLTPQEYQLLVERAALENQSFD
ncbi:MAG: M23 family metallopeptidase [Saprospiraceae bacterium]|nr:M23 family metallopeptidase [Candidatus Opimibacter iunctus]